MVDVNVAPRVDYHSAEGFVFHLDYKPDKNAILSEVGAVAIKDASGKQFAGVGVDTIQNRLHIVNNTGQSAMYEVGADGSLSTSEPGVSAVTIETPEAGLEPVTVAASLPPNYAFVFYDRPGHVGAAIHVTTNSCAENSLQARLINYMVPDKNGDPTEIDITTHRNNYVLDEDGKVESGQAGVLNLSNPYSENQASVSLANVDIPVPQSLGGRLKFLWDHSWK